MKLNNISKYTAILSEETLSVFVKNYTNTLIDDGIDIELYNTNHYN